MSSKQKNLTPEDFHSFGATLGSFASYAKAFTQSTQLELDLVMVEKDYWKSLAPRVQNHRCQAMVEKEPNCLLCMQTVGSQLHLTSKAPEATFVSCCCHAGMTFSVILLTKKNEVGVYLLVGRVIVSDLDDANNQLDMRCPSPRHDGVSDPSSDNIVRMTPESYSAGLSLLKFTLPLLREQVGRHAFHQLLILHPTIHQACRFMEAHFNQGELHLNDVATHCGVSSDWLTRHFRKSMKLTIPGYLSWLRIEHVSRLLETSDHQITEICFESGFSSVSQFNRVFKSLKGVSPSEYRAKL